MKFKRLLYSSLLLSVAVSSLLNGCSSTSTDPYSGWNHGAQTFNDGLDKVLIKPLAQGYQWLTPDFVDHGVTNFFSNMNDIGVAFNDLLQLKMQQSGMDASRFLINTTVGVGGVMDIANKFDLPKHHEDFGQTLGVWGVSAGSYLILPVFGPSSPRDTLGLIGDALLNPLTYVSFIGGTASAVTAGSKLLDVTDMRATALQTEKVVNEATINKDRYEFIKEAYQQRRHYLETDGKVSDDNAIELELEENMNDSSGNSVPAQGVQGAKEETSTHQLTISSPE